MAESEEQLESAVKQVQAPDGSTFDMLRVGGPEEEIRAQFRGNALVDMKAISEAREPELLPYLNGRASYEYLSSSAISHSKKPDVKADLVRVAVRGWIAEGDRSYAVHMLAYSRAAELGLSEFGEDFLLKQYNMSLYGNPGVAWSIAKEIVRSGDQIIKTEDEVHKRRIQSEWSERERKAFEEYAEVTIAQARMPDATEDSVFDIRRIFDHLNWNNKFNNEGSNELYRRIAESMIDIDLKTKGREWMAPIDAAYAGMPDEYIVELKKKVDPEDINRMRNWSYRFREKLSKVLGK